MTTTAQQTDARFGRRKLLHTALAGGSGLLYGAHKARAQNTSHPPAAMRPIGGPDGAHVTIAGPEGGELDNWARTLIPALSRFLSPTMPLRRSLAGGIDGVTGANQFTAQAPPDGTSALLVPGATVLAWQRGDPNVQFDVGRWIPVQAALVTTVIAGRISAAQLTRGQKLRVAVSGANGPESAVLLGLELLGLQPIAVSGMIDAATAPLAFAQHTVDILLLRGPTIGTTLAAMGAQPLCVLGTPGADGTFNREPAFPDIPHLGELSGGFADGRAAAAWRAVAIAAQLAVSLVLPPLAPTGAVAAWRRATAQAAATPELLAITTANAVQPHPNPDAIQTIITNPEAVAAVREWSAASQRR